jgi:hypothetical protein
MDCADFTPLAPSPGRDLDLAGKLCQRLEAAKYKPAILGLTFLKYIPDTFAEDRTKRLAGQRDDAGAKAKDSDELREASQPKRSGGSRAFAAGPRTGEISKALTPWQRLRTLSAKTR